MCGGSRDPLIGLTDSIMQLRLLTFQRQSNMYGIYSCVPDKMADRKSL